MIIWYDKQGKPIPNTELDANDPRWSVAMADIETKLTSDYKIIKQEYTPNKKYWVSTVWLGLDHSFSWHGDEPNPHPLIFETMVFSGRKDRWYKFPGQTKRVYTHRDHDQVRYETEPQARRGHNKLLKEYTDKEKTE